MAAVEILRSAIDSIAKVEILEFFNKNRGAFDTAEQLAIWAGRDAKEMSSDVPTGTVLLVTTRIYCFIFCPIVSAT